MIAMATHRGSAIARGVLGSVTDRVLRSSHVPVMAVHPESLTAFTGTSGQPEVVVVPLDGSKRSESAVSLGVEIAGACGSEIVFLRVVPYPYGVSEIDAAYTWTDYAASHRRLEAESYMVRFVASAKVRGLNARAAALMGAAAPRLLDEVKALPRPLIVMSSRGASGIKRWMVGSVTDKVVRSSGLPVLVVPPNE
jgi:nucleotide-binding universal stress UspA family protein